MRDKDIIKIWKESQMCSEIESHFAEESHGDFQKEFVELVKKCTTTPPEKFILCTECIYLKHSADCKKPKGTDPFLFGIETSGCYYGKIKAKV